MSYLYNQMDQQQKLLQQTLMTLVQYFNQYVQPDVPQSNNQKLNRKMAILSQINIVS